MKKYLSLKNVLLSVAIVVAYVGLVSLVLSIKIKTDGLLGRITFSESLATDTTNGRMNVNVIASTGNASATPYYIADAKVLDPLNDIVSAKEYGNSYINFATSTALTATSTTLVGLCVNSTTAGTVKFFDGTNAGGTTIFNTWTPAIGCYQLFGAKAGTAVYASTTAVIDATLIYNDPTSQR